MKFFLTLTSAALVLAGASSAMAGHHEGMRDGAKHHPGHMFEKADADGDGIITKSEFMDMHEAKFNEMDSDGNGNITKEEAQAAWKEKAKQRHKKESEESAAE